MGALLCPTNDPEASLEPHPIYQVDFEKEISRQIYTPTLLKIDPQITHTPSQGGTTESLESLLDRAPQRRKPQVAQTPLPIKKEPSEFIKLIEGHVNSPSQNQFSLVSESDVKPTKLIFDESLVVKKREETQLRDFLQQTIEQSPLNIVHTPQLSMNLFHQVPIDLKQVQVQKINGPILDEIVRPIKDISMNSFQQKPVIQSEIEIQAPNKIPDVEVAKTQDLSMDLFQQIVIEDEPIDIRQNNQNELNKIIHQVKELSMDQFQQAPVREPSSLKFNKKQEELSIDQILQTSVGDQGELEVVPVAELEIEVQKVSRLTLDQIMQGSAPTGGSIKVEQPVDEFNIQNVQQPKCNIAEIVLQDIRSEVHLSSFQHGKKQITPSFSMSAFLQKDYSDVFGCDFQMPVMEPIVEKPPKEKKVKAPAAVSSNGPVSYVYEEEVAHKARTNDPKERIPSNSFFTATAFPLAFKSRPRGSPGVQITIPNELQGSLFGVKGESFKKMTAEGSSMHSKPEGSGRILLNITGSDAAVKQSLAAVEKFLENNQKAFFEQFNFYLDVMDKDFIATLSKDTVCTIRVMRSPKPTAIPSTKTEPIGISVLGSNFGIKACERKLEEYVATFKSYKWTDLTEPAYLAIKKLAREKPIPTVRISSTRGWPSFLVSLICPTQLFENVKSQIQQLISENQVSILLLQNPIMNKIIGPKGKIVSEIQDKTNCTLIVGPGSVKFIGSERQIKAAEEMVRKIERQNRNFPPPDSRKKEKFLAQFPLLQQEAEGKL